MSVSKSDVIKLIENRMATDQILSSLVNTAKQRVVPMEEAVDVAVRVGDVVLSMPGQPPENVANTIVAAFKGSVYQLLVKIGVSYASSAPTEHTKLVNIFNQAIALVKRGAAQPAPLINLGGEIPGLSLAITPSTAAPSLDSGINLAGATSQGIPLGVTAPAPVPATPPVLSEPVAAPKPTVQQKLQKPIVSTKVNEMESYIEHELKSPVSTEKTTVSARVANERCVKYRETSDWITPIEDLITGQTRAVYFKGADILIRDTTDRYSFLIYSEDLTPVKTDEFFSEHAEFLSRLATLPRIDNLENMMEQLVEITNGMRASVMSYYGHTLADDTTPEVIVGETTRFVNAYLGALARATYNAITLVTNRCRNIPGLKGKLVLDGNIDDLDFFVHDLYPQTIGDNGYSTQQDFFRELFGAIATSLAKVSLQLDGNELVLVFAQVEITISGNYQGLANHYVVGKQSMGATSDPITDIYEEYAARRPEVQLMLRTPDEAYLLLGTGEPTAPIYY